MTRQSLLVMHDVCGLFVSLIVTFLAFYLVLARLREEQQSKHPKISYKDLCFIALLPALKTTTIFLCIVAIISILNAITPV